MMSEYLFKDELKISYPSSFRILSEEEKKSLDFLEKAETFCIKDEDRHIIIVFAYKKAGILSGFVKTEEAIKSM